MAHWTEETYVESPKVIGESMHRVVERADEDVSNLLGLADEHGVDPERTLDVACGIGRHSVELARSGVDVDGVDISPEYVETARERASAAGVAERTAFDVLDVRELDSIGGAYDLVLHWFAFGYFDDAVNETIAEQLRERVADDGVLVLGLDNAEAELGDDRETLASFTGDVLQVERREYRPATGRLEARITKFRETEDGYEFVGEVPWDTRLYTPVEIRRLLERSGFSNGTLYGGLDGSALERGASPLVVVAEP